MTTREDVLAALNDLFSDDEPALWLRNVGPEARRRSRRSGCSPGMDAEQVALAWGRPERIRQDLEAASCPTTNEDCVRTPVRVETWIWPLGVRTACLPRRQAERRLPGP